MNPRKLFLLSLISLSVLISCGPDAEKQQSKITKLEETLINKNEGSYDKTRAVELIQAYQEYTEAFPRDTLSAAYMFKKAELQLHAVSPAEAIKTLDKLINDYPDFRKTPECLFLKGFIYENNMNDLAKAKVAYEEFIVKYPQHYFTDDAKILIQNLGKTPEELVKEFEAKNKE
ncbi:MAG: tol-pal system YbgF family protein [Bacteroidales bacterium]